MSSRRSSIGLRGAGLLVVFALVSLACSFSLGNPDIGVVQPTATRSAPRPTLRPVSTRTPAGEPQAPPQTGQPEGGSQGGAVQETPQIPQTGQEPESSEGVVLQAPETLPQLYEQVSPGAVSILVSANQGGQLGGGEGSGFILSEDGYIVTNNHVVEGGDTYIVRFFNDVDARADLVGADPDSDLAILLVEDMPEGAHPLPLGDSDAVLVGEPVVAIGNPLGIGTSMSFGIVSAIDRVIPSLTQFNIPEAIQTDAPINPGNSGGPLINMRGEVIGINAQIRTTEGGGSIGIGFAVPVNILKLVYPSLIETGSYTWSYLGVSSQIESPLAVQPGDLEAQRGAHIDAIEPGGPADQAGLTEGDVVISADGKEIRSFEDLLSYIAFKRPGDQVELVVLRNGQQGQVTVTLGERPSGAVQ
ncbi:MAG: PDZ domain-containing protein [Chloroflexi bacterium]|nr:PDZ domain-containing protein [Chloroflexota bacterium]